MVKKSVLLLAFVSATVPLLAQSSSLDPADLLKPLSENWTSYSGDYSGKRYSLLKQVDVNAVKNLSLAWANTDLRTGCGPTGVSSSDEGAGRGGAAAAPVIISGFGDGSANRCGPARLEGGILEVNGIIYATTSYNVFAIDAHD